MQTIHILSIGNSFSQDAQRYLHNLARSEDIRIETTNLLIGGCPLERHYRNMQGDKRAYSLEINGHGSTGFMVSIKEALLAKPWDYITIQQVSRLSYQEDSYQPYITELAKYIRTMCPKAKVLLHQTWGYETGSPKCLEHGFQTYDEMFSEIKRCYENIEKDIHADGIIPCGEVFGYALRKGIIKVHRDTFHASLGVGRLLLAMTWYGYLTGNNIDTIKFRDLDEAVTDEEYEIAKAAVKAVLG